MYHEFILDLKSMRKKSGLSQEDCGHLIGSTSNIIGRLERGDRPPTIEEICALQMLFGKTFESFYGTCVGNARQTIADNLKTLPSDPAQGGNPRAREAFLHGLSERLGGFQPQDDA